MARDATTITISVFRDDPAPRTLFHLSLGNAAIASTYAVVDAQSGFSETVLGTWERPVFSGDEIVITPYKSVAPAGYSIYVYVP